MGNREDEKDWEFGKYRNEQIPKLVNGGQSFFSVKLRCKGDLKWKGMDGEDGIRNIGNSENIIYNGMKAYEIKRFDLWIPISFQSRCIGVVFALIRLEGATGIEALDSLSPSVTFLRFGAGTSTLGRLVLGPALLV